MGIHDGWQAWWQEGSNYDYSTAIGQNAMDLLLQTGAAEKVKPKWKMFIRSSGILFNEKPIKYRVHENSVQYAIQPYTTWSTIATYYPPEEENLIERIIKEKEKAVNNRQYEHASNLRAAQRIIEGESPIHTVAEEVYQLNIDMLKELMNDPKGIGPIEDDNIRYWMERRGIKPITRE